MIDRFSLIFSAISISLAFFRLFIIQEKFSNEVFRGYTLFIIPALFLVELENIKFDFARRQNNYNNNSTNFAFIVLLSIPIVLLHGITYGNIDDNYIAVYVLSCGAIVDGFINVNTASRSSKKNSYLIIARLASLIVLYLINIYYYFSFLIVLIFLLKNEISLRRLAQIKDSFSNNEILNYLIAAGGRLKEWNITYFFQIAISSGEIYFYFYIYSKILQNISGFIYTYFRSSIKTDTTKLYIASKRYIRALYPAPLLIYIMNIYISMLFIPILAFIENLSAQFILYSNLKKPQLNLLLNNIVCFLFLSILYLFNPSGKFIISYISISYVLGVILLFSKLDCIKRKNFSGRI